MFKRVTKRVLKRKREEEVGIDNEMRETLGLHDTDSDESESESSGSDSESASNKDALGPQRISQKKRRLSLSQGLSDDEDIDGPVEIGDMDDASSQGSVEIPPVSTADVVQNPIYEVTYGSYKLRCVICPLKTLKDDDATTEHLESKSHIRRTRKFESILSSNEFAGIDDPHEIIRLIDIQQQQNQNSGNNKGPKIPKAEKWRAIRARRQEVRARRRARRADQQVKTAVQFAVPYTLSDGSPPALKKKRRKIDEDVVIEKISTTKHINAHNACREQKGGNQSSSTKIKSTTKKK